MTLTVAEHRFADPAGAAAALASKLAADLEAATAARGVALMALSGGRSPATLLQELRAHELDWSKVIVAQVDERWVAPDHADSNSRLIRDHLLVGAAAGARFVPMKNAAATASAGQAECERALRDLPLPFDIVLLGMGEDGHTASLFPAADALAEGLTTHALCVSVTPPTAPHERMSLSLAGLLASRMIILQIAGVAKEAVYRRALGDGPVEDMPVRAVLRQQSVPVEVWISS